MNLQGVNSSLLRAVRALVTESTDMQRSVGPARPALVVESFESEPWASLTFAGMRHTIEFRIEGKAAAVAETRTRLAGRLLEPELAIPGYFVADTELSDTGSTSREDGTMSLSLRLQALTIEE